MKEILVVNYLYLMVLVQLDIPIIHVIKENGTMENFMVKVFSHGKTVLSMMVSISMEKNMEMELLPIHQRRLTLVNGEMENKREREHYQTLSQIFLSKEAGKMVNS